MLIRLPFVISASSPAGHVEHLMGQAHFIHPLRLVWHVHK